MVREMTGQHRWYAAWAMALVLVVVSHAQDAHDATAPTVKLESGALKGMRFGDGQQEPHSSACLMRRRQRASCAGSRQSLSPDGQAYATPRSMVRRARSFLSPG